MKAHDANKLYAVNFALFSFYLNELI